jgi:hypothetical protein
LKGEGGAAAAAAAARWLAAAAVTAGSAYGLGEQPGRLHFSRRLLAVLRGRPRILVPVRQYYVPAGTVPLLASNPGVRSDVQSHAEIFGAEIWGAAQQEPR